jgi:DNA polymerase-3 subunit gamma/tau
VNCKAIASGTAVDVMEIDAASRNKVEDIRDLRDKVGYTPIEFPYKIYIIDEVHMVTTAGFNALLKTLEEPPSHVKFLFATTEPHKLPITILSRCIRFDFHRIALDDLARHLIWIAGQEGFGMDMQAGLLLSRLAEGSARDAISLLDQLTVYCTDTITAEAAQELFQLGDPELPVRMLALLRGDDRRAMLDVWNELVEQGADTGRFLVQVSEALKEAYLSDPDSRLRESLSVLWESLNLLRFESFPALLVELSLLRCYDILHGNEMSQTTQQARPIQERQGPAVEARQASRPEPTQQMQQAPGDGPAPRESARLEPRVETTVRPHARQKPVEPLEISGDAKWSELLRLLEQRSLTTYALVRLDVKPVVNGNELRLEFEDNGPSNLAVRYVMQAEHSQVLLAAVREVYGQDLGLTVKLAEHSASISQPGHEESEGDSQGKSATIDAVDKSGVAEMPKPLTADDAIQLFGATELKDGD